jgi:hypothetical protein
VGDDVVERHGRDEAEVAGTERRRARLRRRRGGRILEIDLLAAEPERVALLPVGAEERFALEAERALVEARRGLDVGNRQDEVIDAIDERRHAG